MSQVSNITISNTNLRSENFIYDWDSSWKTGFVEKGQVDKVIHADSFYFELSGALSILVYLVILFVFKFIFTLINIYSFQTIFDLTETMFWTIYTYIYFIALGEY